MQAGDSDVGDVKTAYRYQDFSHSRARVCVCVSFSTTKELFIRSIASSTRVFVFSFFQIENVPRRHRVIWVNASIANFGFGWPS